MIFWLKRDCLSYEIQKEDGSTTVAADKADIDGDKRITQIDRMLLARYIAGWALDKDYFD